MNEGQQKCLNALNEQTYPDGEMCVPFAPIITATGFDRATVRCHVRELARQGYAQFFRGLWTDGGEPAGAGYCITQQGKHFLQDREANQ